MLHGRTYFSKYSCGTLHNNDVKITRFEVLTTTRVHKCESIILYFHSETASINLILGYFAHILRRERDGPPQETYNSAKLCLEVTFSLTSPSYIVKGSLSNDDGDDNENVISKHKFALL